jgi:hypothetical protein
VRVELASCTETRNLESFAFTLSGPVNATLARAGGRVYILRGAASLTSLTVAPTAQTVQIGADRSFTATGRFADDSTQDLTNDVNWSSSAPAVATINAAGRAHAVAGGTTTISATIGAVSDSTELTVPGPQPSPPTITFPAPGNRTFGAADFALGATSSSGQAVSYTADGACTVVGAQVHLTGAGTCTITASQGTATPVTRTFTIARAAQAISFGALADRTVGDPEVALSASASSGLAIGFSASGPCNVSGAALRLTGAGTCTVAATQTGNANYAAATSVSRSFVIRPRPVPPGPVVRCKVPKVVGKTLAAAKKAIAAAHCATGKVRKGYSGKVKKNKVVSQSRKPRKLYAAGTRIDLVVSRGRRR